jgi:hypothetical protein
VEGCGGWRLAIDGQRPSRGVGRVTAGEN